MKLSEELKTEARDSRNDPGVEEQLNNWAKRAETLENELELLREDRDRWRDHWAFEVNNRVRALEANDLVRKQVAKLREELASWDSGEGPERASDVSAILDRMPKDPQ